MPQGPLSSPYHRNPRRRAPSRSHGLRADTKQISPGETSVSGSAIIYAQQRTPCPRRYLAPASKETIHSPRHSRWQRRGENTRDSQTQRGPSAEPCILGKAIPPERQEPGDLSRRRLQRDARAICHVRSNRPGEAKRRSPSLPADGQGQVERANRDRAFSATGVLPLPADGTRPPCSLGAALLAAGGRAAWA